MENLNKKPRYTTGVAAEIIGVPLKTILNYENAEISQASRGQKGRRLFSQQDLFRILVISDLVKNRGVTKNGIHLLFDLRKKILADKKFDILDYCLTEKQKSDFIEKIS